MEIKASDVKTLREATGAGMMACKAALQEANGDMAAATKLLREKGLADAAKKQARIAAEGKVVIAVNADRTRGLLLELNCETDFAANNANFTGAADAFAAKLLAGSFATVADAEASPLGEEVKQLSAKIGEKVTLRRFQQVAAPAGGLLVDYRHFNGKIGVLLAGSGPAAAAETLRQVAMHVAASQPQCLDRSGVSAEQAAAEKDVYRAQLAQDEKMAGKPDAVKEKIVEGKLNKYYEQVCLLEQPYIHDDKQKVGDVLKGAGVAVTTMALFVLGEGIEKKSQDLAAEVAKELAKHA